MFLYPAPHRGALASRLLLALICDPELQTQTQGSLSDCEVSSSVSPLLLCFKCFSSRMSFCLRQPQYLDAACSLLFELLLLGHEVSSDSMPWRSHRFAGDVWGSPNIWIWVVTLPCVVGQQVFFCWQLPLCWLDPASPAASSSPGKLPHCNSVQGRVQPWIT